MTGLLLSGVEEGLESELLDVLLEEVEPVKTLDVGSRAALECRWMYHKL